MALGILIAQTRGAKMPKGYFEGLGSLGCVVRRPGRTFSRHQLLSALWADVYDPDQRTVDGVVVRIRKMLARLGADHVIRTVHNEGYRLSSTIRPRARINAPGPVANPYSFGASPSWPVCPVFNA